MTDVRQQFGVEIEISHRHQIDDADGDPLLNQGCALGDEEAAVFGSVLVRRADDFDGRDEVAMPFRVVDADFVFVVIGQRRLNGNAGLRRGPDGRSMAR